jgi:peroxiredoxin Q/BCP
MDLDMAELSPGDAAPGFVLPGDGARTVRLADFGGKIVVLFFYPQDGTETCTAEAVDFSGLLPAFAAAGAVVIGVSPDSPKKHDKFKAKHGLAQILASDEDGQTIRDYGVWGEKTLFGRKYIGVVRSTFLVDQAGRIARIWRGVRVRGHAAEVLKAVEKITQ